MGGLEAGDRSQRNCQDDVEEEEGTQGVPTKMLLFHSVPPTKQNKNKALT